MNLSGKQAVWLAAAFSAGLLLGLFAGNRDPFGRGSRGEVHEVRSQGYRFIRPLLECEFDRDAAVNRELVSFRADVERVVAACLNEGLAAEVSVYFRDLDNGHWFSIAPERDFIPASLLKVPLMISVFRLAEKDPMLLTGEVLISDDFPIDWGQTLTPAEVLERGRAYTIEDLVYRMIVYSDNGATAVLNQLFPPDLIAETNRDLGVGFHESGGKPGYLSVETYASFLRILYNASYLNREMSERALALLAQVQFQGGILAGLPRDVEIAHKFGHWTLPPGEAHRQQFHDFAIVYHPNRPYLLGVMTRGSKLPELAAAVSRVSAEVYRHVDLQSAEPLN